MRRLGRWILNTLTILSLLLCVGTCVLWVRSYQRNEALVDSRDVSGFLVSGGGDWGIYWRTCAGKWIRPHLTYMAVEDDRSSAVRWLETRAGPQVFRSRLVNVYWERLGPPPLIYVLTVTGPYWLLVVLFCCLPATRLGVGVLRRFRPRSRNGCPSCNYDLTANVSGVCPECGTAVANTKVIA